MGKLEEKLLDYAVDRFKHATRDLDDRSGLGKAAASTAASGEMVITSMPVGMLPNPVQNRAAEKAGLHPAETTFYSAGMGILTNIGQCFWSGALEPANLSIPMIAANALGIEELAGINIATVIKHAGYWGIFDAWFRTTYACAFGRACGALFWEAGYALKEAYIDPLNERMFDTKAGFVLARPVDFLKEDFWDPLKNCYFSGRQYKS